MRSAVPAGLSSPTTATTRGPCSTTSATRTAHGQVHRNGARPVQGLLERLTLDLGHLSAAASGRRQARDDFCLPLNHFRRLAGPRCYRRAARRRIPKGRSSPAVVARPLVFLVVIA